MRRGFAAAAALMLGACAGTFERAEPPPDHALSAVTCDTGGRHGPTGVMDWTCVDGDGERRLPVRSLHEVIDGESDDADERRAARRDRLDGPSHSPPHRPH
ncbi:MAG: hypothetical protein ACFE0P_06610 [Oceanicaulis sp.]